MTEWERMTTGRLYDPGKEDIDPRHRHGMELCDRFNRTPLRRRRKKARLLEKQILVRQCMNFPGIDDGRHLRLAVKDEASNARFIKELEEDVA